MKQNLLRIIGNDLEEFGPEEEEIFTDPEWVEIYRETYLSHNLDDLVTLVIGKNKIESKPRLEIRYNGVLVDEDGLEARGRFTQEDLKYFQDLLEMFCKK